MDIQHRTTREILKQFTKPKAKRILQELLPEREYLAIFYCDIEDWPRWKVGEEKLFCEQSQVSRIKSQAYERLKTELNSL
jgi:DNA-directed RNA polymerase specialized sigma subunit